MFLDTLEIHYDLYEEPERRRGRSLLDRLLRGIEPRPQSREQRAAVPDDDPSGTRRCQLSAN